MAEYESLLVQRKDGVAIITLNRPEVLNAMNTQLNGELQAAVVDADGNEDIGCIVITGSGDKAFTAGGDIHEQRENDAKFSEAELDTKREFYMKGAYEISASKKPTIGMRNGLAYGGGAALASCSTCELAAKLQNSAFSPPLMVASTAPGPCPIKSAGRWRKSCCSPHASLRPKRLIGLAF